MNMNREIAVGNRYGSLVVIGRILGQKRNARVKCDCGSEFDTYTYNLSNGTTRRCLACANAERKGKANLANRIDPRQRTINEQWNIFRKAARSKGADFIDKTTWLDIVLSVCVYCGAGPSNCRKASVPHAEDFWYNGVDRVDSSRGYEPENVQAACWTCNRMKGNMSHDDFLAHVRRIQ